MGRPDKVFRVWEKSQFGVPFRSKFEVCANNCVPQTDSTNCVFQKSNDGLCAGPEAPGQPASRAHFSDKKQLLEQLLKQLFEQLFEHLFEQLFEQLFHVQGIVLELVFHVQGIFLEFMFHVEG